VKKIPRILKNPKVHYRTHNSPPPVPILSQSNPVHASSSHFSHILFNIIPASRPRSSKVFSFSIRSPYKNTVRISPIPHTCHISRPPHYSDLIFKGRNVQTAPKHITDSCTKRPTQYRSILHVRLKHAFE